MSCAKQGSENAEQGWKTGKIDTRRSPGSPETEKTHSNRLLCSTHGRRFFYGSVSGIGIAADCKSVAGRHFWFESRAAHYFIPSIWSYSGSVRRDISFRWRNGRRTALRTRLLRVQSLRSATVGAGLRSPGPHAPRPEYLAAGFFSRNNLSKHYYVPVTQWQTYRAQATVLRVRSLRSATVGARLRSPGPHAPRPEY